MAKFHLKNCQVIGLILCSPPVPSGLYWSRQRLLNAFFSGTWSYFLMPSTLFCVQNAIISVTWQMQPDIWEEVFICPISMYCLIMYWNSVLDSSVLLCPVTIRKKMFCLFTLWPKYLIFAGGPFFFLNILVGPFCKCHGTSSDIYQLPLKRRFTQEEELTH